MVQQGASKYSEQQRAAKEVAKMCTSRGARYQWTVQYKKGTNVRDGDVKDEKGASKQTGRAGEGRCDVRMEWT